MSKTDIGELNIRIGANLEGLNKGLKDFEKAMKRVDRQLTGFAQVGRRLQGIGKDLTMKLTLPLLAAGAAAVKFGADFEESMVKSLAIMEDVSDKMRSAMERTARDIALQMSVSAKDAAEGFYFLASAGLDAAQSLAALPDVTKFSIAGEMQLAEATDLLVDAQTALGFASADATENLENMNRVSDVLVKASIMSTATVLDLSKGLTTKVAGAFRMAGRSVEEAVAGLSVFAKQGVKGEQAGDALHIVMRDLQTRALKNAAAFKQLNIQVFDSGGKMRSLADIFADFERALDGMSDKEKRAALMFLGLQDRSIAYTQQLIGMSGLMREFQQELENSGGTAAEVAEKMQQSFNAQFMILKNTFQDIGISVSKILLPPLTSLVKKMQSWARGLSGLADKLSEVHPLIINVGIAAAGFVMAIGPIAWISGGVIRGIYDIAKAFAVLKAIQWGSLIASITTLIGQMVVVAGLGTLILASMSALGQGVAAKIQGKGWGEAWDIAKKDFLSTPDKLFGGLKKMAEDLGEIGKAIGSNLSAGVEESTGNLFDFLGQDGSAVPAAKTAAELFAEEFQKTWEKEWEIPMALGELDALEKQADKLSEIERSLASLLTQTWGADWRKEIEGARAYERVWDEIFDKRQKLAQQQIDDIQARPFNEQSFYKASNIIQMLEAFAKTSVAKMEIARMKSGLSAWGGSEIWRDASSEFNRVFELWQIKNPEADAQKRAGMELTLWQKFMGEALYKLRADSNFAGTPEEEVSIKAYKEQENLLHEKLVAAIKEAYEKTMTFKDNLIETANVLKDKFLSGTGLQDVFSAMTPEAKEAFGAAWGSLKEKLAPAWDTLKETFLGLWGSIKEKMAPLIEKGKEFFAPVMDKVAPMFGGLGEAVGPLGGMFSALLGPISVLIGMSETFGLVVENVMPIVQALADALGRVLEPLLPLIVLLSDTLIPVYKLIGEVLSVLLVPVLRTLFEVLRGLNIVILGVAKVISQAWNALASAINWALGWLGVNIPKIDTKGIDDALKHFVDLTWDEAMARAKNTEELNKSTEALRNVPQGFKIALRRFQAAQGIPAMAEGGIVRARAGGTIARLGEGGEDEFVIPRSKLGGPAIHIHGDVYGWDDFKRKVAQATSEISRRSGLRTHGLART